MRVRVLALLVFASCSACAADADPPALDELEAVPFPSTKLLQPADLVGLDSAPDGTLTFRAAPVILRDAAPGTVLVAGISPATPVGLLRVVVGVARDGDRLVLTTASAPIQLAFRKLHARIARTIPDLAAGATLTTGRGLAADGRSARGLGGGVSATLPLDLPLFDADGDASTTNDQVSIKGSIGGGLRYDLSIDVDWGEVLELPSAVGSCILTPLECTLEALLPEVAVRFEVDPRLEAELALVGSASLSYEKELEIASLVLPPIPLGPLVFLPSADLIAKVGGSASAGFTLGARGSVEFATSFVASTDHAPALIPFALVHSDLAANDTAVTLAAEAKVGLGVRLNLQLYGIVGPNATARVFARVAGDVSKDPCWDVHIGVEGELGVLVSSPTLPVLGRVTLFSWTSPPFVAIDEEVAHGSCAPVPHGPQLPPGHGPDADSLANPSFTPWSTPFPESSAAITTPTGEGREWTDLALAIDGRYVIAGSRADRLTKVDDAGALIWSRRYRRAAGVPPLILRRTTASLDAALWVLTSAQDGEGTGLLKVDQAGHVLLRERLELAATCPVFEGRQLLGDGAAGTYLTGVCQGGASVAVLHLDASGNVIDLQQLADAEGTRSVEPTAAAMVDGALVVVGQAASTGEGTSMFALRLPDALGQGGYSKRYTNCESPRSIVPLTAHPFRDGQVLIAGSSGNDRTGMVARLRADGEIAFAGFQTINQDDYFFLTGFAELPTTGFIATASTYDVTHQVVGLGVLGLDGAGRPLWSERYTPGDLRPLSHGALLLTNDGGVVVAALAGPGAGEGEGGFSVMKLYAKDGQARDVSSEPLPVHALTCAMTALPWAITIAAGRAAAVPVATEVE